MSLLRNLKEYLYGMPGQTSIDTGDEPASGQGTQGLIGTGGEAGKGLLQQNFNAMNQGKGLLSNIPEAALVGAALYGEGLKGKDPLAGAFPAVLQSAQLKKLMTPKVQKPTAYINKSTGKPELVTPQKYAANPELYDPLPQIKMFETSEQKELGKSAGEEFNTLTTSAATALENNNNLDVMQELVNLDNIKTGFAGNLRTTVASLAKEFGVDTNIQNLTAAEALNAVSGSIVLDGLANFKGAISDGERAFLVSITPGLTNTIEGNKLLIQIGKRTNDLGITLAGEAEKWVQENGGLSQKNAQGQSWQQFKAAFHKANPVLNKELKGQIQSLSTKVDEDFSNNIVIVDGIKYQKVGKRIFEIN